MSSYPQNENIHTPTRLLKIELPGLNSPISSRQIMKTSNSVNLEAFAIQEKYLDTLNEKNGFPKETGYFTNFTTRNKILIDQYKVSQSPKSRHSRYTSKPVFFTTLKSKNKLSESVAADHYELLKMNKQSSAQSFLPLDRSNQFSPLENVNTLQDKDDSKSFQNGLLPTLNSRKTTQRNYSQALPKYRENSNKSPRESSQNSKITSRRIDHSEVHDVTKTSNFLTLTNMTNKSPTNLLIESPCSKDFIKQKSHKKLSEKIKNHQEFKDIVKYHTKEMTESLTQEYTERAKIDSNKYLEHKVEIDNLRDSTIAVALMDQDKKFLRNHPGSPKPYLGKSSREGYTELDSKEAISQFEENLLGWMKSVPNFGKQRWTYDKNWEFRLI